MLPDRLSRRSLLTTTGAAAAAGTAALTGVAATAAPSTSVGGAQLLTDPFLQLPTDRTVNVVWFTEFEGTEHSVLVGHRVDRLDEDQLQDAAGRRSVYQTTRVYHAETTRLSRVAEDAASYLPEDQKPSEGEGIVERDVFRHEATVRVGDMSGRRVPYRVVSLDGEAMAASAAYGLRGVLRPGRDAVIMLTSDHQAMIDTPANLELAEATITRELGEIDAVLFAGDLVNNPDRASEWFDDARGSAFFPVLQGTADRVARDGRAYHGAAIIQSSPIYPVIGNHEVQGRRDGATDLATSFNYPVPREVAEKAYEEVAAEVNPDGDPNMREHWIENNSWSSRTYEEIFTLPEDGPAGEKYYATTIGDIRLISLFSTRIWRDATATPEPAERTATSRYQEAADVIDEPLERGYGEFPFDTLAVGSEQYEWLADELASSAVRKAKYTIVMLHEGPNTLGGNVMPHFGFPEEIVETDDSGEVVGVRYEYPESGNFLLHDLQPLLEGSDVDLVYNGHNHVWNRFRSDNGTTNWLEAAHTGNTYNAYHELSGKSREVPPEPWEAENYLAQGNPGGLEAIVPSLAPRTTADGQPQPFIERNGTVVFQALHTGTGVITSWYVDLLTEDQEIVKFDEFRIG